MAERLYTGLVKKQLRGNREDAKTLEREARIKVGYLFDRMLPGQTFTSGSWSLGDGRSVTAFVWNDVMGKRATVRLVGIGYDDVLDDAEVYLESGLAISPKEMREKFGIVAYPSDVYARYLARETDLPWLDYLLYKTKKDAIEEGSLAFNVLDYGEYRTSVAFEEDDLNTYIDPFEPKMETKAQFLVQKQYRNYSTQSGKLLKLWQCFMGANLKFQLGLAQLIAGPFTASNTILLQTKADKSYRLLKITRDGIWEASLIFNLKGTILLNYFNERFQARTVRNPTTELGRTQYNIEAYIFACAIGYTEFIRIAEFEEPYKGNTIKYGWACDWNADHAAVVIHENIYDPETSCLDHINAHLYRLSLDQDNITLNNSSRIMKWRPHSSMNIYTPSDILPNEMQIWSQVDPFCPKGDYPTRGDVPMYLFYDNTDILVIIYYFQGVRGNYGENTAIDYYSNAKSCGGGGLSGHIISATNGYLNGFFASGGGLSIYDADVFSKNSRQLSFSSAGIAPTTCNEYTLFDNEPCSPDAYYELLAKFTASGSEYRCCNAGNTAIESDMYMASARQEYYNRNGTNQCVMALVIPYFSCSAAYIISLDAFTGNETGDTATIPAELVHVHADLFNSDGPLGDRKEMVGSVYNEYNLDTMTGWSNFSHGIGRVTWNNPLNEYKVKVELVSRVLNTTVYTRSSSDRYDAMKPNLNQYLFPLEYLFPFIPERIATNISVGRNMIYWAPQPYKKLLQYDSIGGIPTRYYDGTMLPNTRVESSVSSGIWFGIS